MAEVGVLVPVVLGAGVVFSLLTELRDISRRVRSHRWLTRRARVHGHATAQDVLGELGGNAAPVGVRSRSTYVAVALLFGVLTIWVGRGSWGNFVGWTWWAEGIAWLLVVSLAGAAAFGMIAVVAGVLAWRRSCPPAWTVPWLARTPLGHEHPAG